MRLSVRGKWDLSLDALYKLMHSGVEIKAEQYATVFQVLIDHQRWKEIVQLYGEGAVRGELPPRRGAARAKGKCGEGCIDLHELEIPTAKAGLLYCLSDLRVEYERNEYVMHPLKILTGRGKSSPDGKSILREEIRTWAQENFDLWLSCRSRNPSVLRVTRPNLKSWIYGQKKLEESKKITENVQMTFKF